MTTTHTQIDENNNPVITSIMPSSATAGTSISIEVENYEEVNSIQFGSTTFNNLQGDSGVFKVVAPSVISLGTVNVTVSTLGGASSEPVEFTYKASPFLVRDNLNDAGGHSAGAHWVSPDIICYAQDTLDLSSAQSTYGQYISKDFTNGENNNFYIRAKNLSNESQSGFVQLHFATASLLLTPETWHHISVPASSETFSGANGAEVGSQGICITETPFNFTGVPTGGHFCMIAIASQTGTTFPVPKSFPNNGAMALWVKSNPNVSQRNMSFAPINTNVGTFNMSIGNNNPSSSKFTVFVSPDVSGTDFPTGTTIQAKITDSRAPYKSLVNPWDPTNGASFGNIQIPGGINGGPGNSLINLEVIITLPKGKTFSGNNYKAISITYGQYGSPEGMYEEEKHVLQECEIAHPEDPSMLKTVKIIILGSCNFRFSV